MELLYKPNIVAGDTLIVFDFNPWSQSFSGTREMLDNIKLIKKHLAADCLVAGRKKNIPKKELKDNKEDLDDIILSYKYVLFSGLQIGSLYIPSAKNIKDSIFSITEYPTLTHTVRMGITETPATLTNIFYENFENILVADINFVQKAQYIKEDEIEYNEINTLDELKSQLLLEKDGKLLPISIDLETTGISPWKKDQKIISFACATEVNKGFNIMVDHPRYYNPEGREILKWVCSLDNSKIAHNAKFEYIWIEKFYEIPIKGTLFDTMLISHLLNENLSKGTKRYSLAGSVALYLNCIPHKEEYLAKTVTNKKKPKVSKKNIENNDVDILKSEADRIKEEFKEKDFTLLDRNDLLHYGVLDVVLPLRIFYKQKRLMASEGSKTGWNILARDLHDRLTRSLGSMEWEGMIIDTDEVMDVIKQCDAIIDTESAKLSGMAPNINFSSKKDLSEFINSNYPELNNKLELDTRGDFVLDISSVRSLMEEYPWLKSLVHYRHALKAKSTYMLSFLQFANNGKVHFNFSIHGTATGRLSCQNPNMQNIPKQIGDMKSDGYSLKIKNVFKPKEGDVLVNLDLASAEIFMMALYSEDATLIKNLNSGLDFHSMTASQISDFSYEEIIEAKDAPPDVITDRQKEAKRMRSGAKAVSFGIPYGTSAKGMAQRQGWTEAYAEDLIKKFFTLYPGVKSWIESVKKKVKETGYVETFFGRKRHFDIVHYSPSQYVIGRIERQAVNFLIQSATSDWFQYLIYDILNDIPELTAHITVHDSLVFSLDTNKLSVEGLKEKLNKILIDKPSELWPDIMKVKFKYDLEVGESYGI